MKTSVERCAGPLRVRGDVARIRVEVVEEMDCGGQEDEVSGHVGRPRAHERPRNVGIQGLVPTPQTKLHSSFTLEN